MFEFLDILLDELQVAFVFPLLVFLLLFSQRLRYELCVAKTFQLLGKLVRF